MSKIAFGWDGLETIPSIKRHVAEATGFQYSKIEPLEITYQDDYCTSVAFRVNGYGFKTDFATFEMAPAYNAIAEY